MATNGMLYVRELGNFCECLDWDDNGSLFHYILVSERLFFLQDPVRGLTPLHCAIYGYHTDRVDETCDFIDQLLTHGANPHFTSKSGETAPLLAIGRDNFCVNAFNANVKHHLLRNKNSKSWHYCHFGFDLDLLGSADETLILKLYMIIESIHSKESLCF